MDIEILGYYQFLKAMFNKVMFSSLKLDWKTPADLFKKLNSEFHFDYDPCPSSPKHDGLKISWGKRNFVNPPYGKEIGKWIKKGFDESLKGKLVVFLIPSRTDTKWWHDYIMKSKEIRFIKGRLKFSGNKNSAPFPSAIVIFNLKSNGTK